MNATTATTIADDSGVELARYVTGALDGDGTVGLCQVVTVEQRGPEAFVVNNYESADGERSETKSTPPFTTAREAFKHALKLVADEVEDLVDDGRDTPDPDDNCTGSYP